MKANFIKFFLTLTCLFLLNGCQGERSKLIDQFESNMSIEEARLILSPHLKQWKIFIEQPDFKVVHINNYQSLAITGRLSLVFTDGKLSDSCFLTTEIREYIKNLERTSSIKFKRGKDFWRAKVYPYTIVFFKANLSNQKICWYDKRFEDSYYGIFN